jgi:dGTPase
MEPSAVSAGAFLHRTRAVREAAEDLLAPAATRSTASRGRTRPERPDPYRTAFERDRDRILHSKSFRRLKHKTQVFIEPEGDHYVTRLTHTLQVTQIARAVASGLGLNEALTEAIALGHDVGHAPFGHTGEDTLSAYFVHGWHHAAQSVRIYEVLEDCNLTAEVRDGIRAHSWKVDPPPTTPEGQCVRYADRIAYLTHDALDALRSSILRPEDFPSVTRSYLGPPGSAWIGRMITAVIQESLASGRVSMAPDLLEMMHELRAFMFARVYGAGHAEQKRDAEAIIRRLVEHHLAHPESVPPTYRDTGADPTTQVVDYVSGMTDRYARALHQRIVGS